MKRIFALMFMALAIGCHAQVPPATNHTVTLTWTVPTTTSTWTGCTTQAPCSYAIYRATTSGSCPPSTSTAFSEVTNPASRPTGTTYTDSTASGLTVCYIAKTMQGTSGSDPSNATAVVTVPGTPTAPALGNPSVASNELPKVQPALPELASLPEGAGRVVLVARISR